MTDLLYRGFYGILLGLTLSACTTSRPIAPHAPVREEASRLEQRLYRKTALLLNDCRAGACEAPLSPLVRMDSFAVDGGAVSLFLNPAAGYGPIREDAVSAWYGAWHEALGRKGRALSSKTYVAQHPLESLVPNAYRSQLDRDSSRVFPREQVAPWVRFPSRPYEVSAGLDGRHVGLWHSHGWYYEPKLNRWEWQRARLFQTVEDVLPMSFVLPYLAPMLEDAGAVVVLPRERDPQRHMVIIDQDDAPTQVGADSLMWLTTGTGFSRGRPPYEGDVNPFTLGTLLRNTAPANPLTYASALPESGRYAVYVSYGFDPDATDRARYTVHHLGGETTVDVNQQMGWGTWVYLGTYAFDEADAIRVSLASARHRNEVVTADAVRLGGGMGDVARHGQTSGRPRYLEGARYYLQFAGMPDTLVYRVTGLADDDYRDDYQSRAEWVNYLRGAPFGPNRNRSVNGLGVPMDYSMAFHTDAGVTRRDTTIGTLMIYSTTGAQDDGAFPNGVDRLANRDAADIMQTELVRDLRATFEPQWTRRAMWDRNYSEAVRPNVPGVLLELLSHQNFYDMRYGLDPAFRFTAARALYKGIGRFLAEQAEATFVPTPLPIEHLHMVQEGPEMVLSWEATPDPQEPGAEPTGYLIYVRNDSTDFGQPLVTQETTIRLPVQTGSHQHVQIRAFNDGGRSFPSETLSWYIQPGGAPRALVVNAFDRVAPPAIIDTETYQGFAAMWDEGVPDGTELSFIGEQHSFIEGTPWSDDDAPGHGASHANFEGKVVAGNTRDYARIHGEALVASGYSYLSTTDDAVTAGRATEAFDLVDILLGEERKTYRPTEHGGAQFEALPPPMQAWISGLIDSQTPVLITGSYVGSDLVDGKAETDPAVVFARETLGLTFRTRHGGRSGQVVDGASGFMQAGEGFSFFAYRNAEMYNAEAPDGLDPIAGETEVLLRYADSNISAAIGKPGSHIIMGFPFETITHAPSRARVMQAIITYLSR